VPGIDPAPVCSGVVELIWIRHGQPAWSVDGLAIDDPALTALGKQQAIHLGKRFADLEVDHLFVSPLLRAQQTMEPIAEALGVVPETLPWLAEIAAPVWEGTPTDQVEAVFDSSRRRPLDELWDGIPGGESFRDFHARVTNGLCALITDLGAERVHDAPPLWRLDRDVGRVVLVAHAGTNSVSLGSLLGIDPVPWEWERFVLHHAAMSTVRLIEMSDAHTFSLFRFADTAHLPDELHTV